MFRIFLIFFTLFSYTFALTTIEKNDIAIFNKNKESVVFITTRKKVVDHYTLTKYVVPRGSGSGFIWSNKGYIVTNFHVINGASSATVKLHNGKSYKASLVGSYPRRDIAVLKINATASELKSIKIGSSSKLSVGQALYAIGNPFGLDWTMTKGIVSGLNRKVSFSDGGMLTGAIQTDAAINPGNSGGVLLDSSGKVVGVNSAIYSPSGANVGIGFGIPIDLVKRVVNKIVKYGHYIKPSIGIESDDRVNTYLFESLNIKGVAILGILRGSDANNKGLIPARLYNDGTVDFGDIIVKANGKSVENIYMLDDILESLQIGSRVDLTILRGDKYKKVSIKLMGLDI